MHNKVYTNSEVYDLAFSYRDYDSDSQILLNWYRELTGRRSEPKRILELACGPGRMLLALCSNGASGIGIDISEEMCQFAKRLADESGKNVRIDSGKMNEFALSKEFDLIVTMLNSISHITSAELLRRHLACVLEHLAPGGLYIIETTRNDVRSRIPDSQWSVSRGKDQLNICWGGEGKLEHANITGFVGDQKINISEKFPMRYWKTPELLCAAETAGLTLAGCFGNFSKDTSAELESCVKLTTEQCGLHQCIVFTC